MALNDLNDLIGPIAERIVTTYSDRPDALIESFRRRHLLPENIQQWLNLGLAQRITDHWNELVSQDRTPPGSLDQMLNAINLYSRPIPPIGNGGRSRRRKLQRSRRRKSRR